MESREQYTSESSVNAVDHPSIQKTLLCIVITLEHNSSLQDDLLQEALIHFWLIQRQRTGQSLSWYLQSCRFHLLNHLSRGRSVDAWKRRHARHVLQEECDPENTLTFDVASDDTLMGSVTARDLIEVISQRIKPLERRTLSYLAEGFGVREIARKLHVSHQAVSKQRKRIATLAIQLGASPLSRCGSRKPNWRPPSS
jgi:DNA-directed RNA polymerase specialized sigma24 family protein